MKCNMYSVSNEEFLELIRRSSSIKDVVFSLGYNSNSGETNLLFHKRCEELGIDWKKEFRTKNCNKTKRTEENVFCEDSTADQATLRAWYVKGEYSEYKCSICNISEWNNKELTLRLDHINGHNHDNRLDNLRWVCPNCDSQLDTYCGKNVKYRVWKKGNYCIDCGEKITNKRGVKRCVKCFKKKQHENRKVVNRPSKEQLLEKLTKSNFVQVGKEYGVTDNAVRKWCESYGMPTKSSYYRQLDL